jgi:uncharacterized protein (DUF433 family)
VATDLIDEDRIVRDPAICGGRPTVRGTRIRVVDILELLAAGMTANDLLADYDELRAEDIRAAILYAARNLAPAVKNVA